jgi:hypothetical protein
MSMAKVFYMLSDFCLHTEFCLLSVHSTHTEYTLFM